MVRSADSKGLETEAETTKCVAYLLWSGLHVNSGLFTSSAYISTK